MTCCHPFPYSETPWKPRMRLAWLTQLSPWTLPDNLGYSYPFLTLATPLHCVAYALGDRIGPSIGSFFLSQRDWPHRSSFPRHWFMKDVICQVLEITHLMLNDLHIFPILSSLYLTCNVYCGQIYMCGWVGGVQGMEEKVGPTLRSQGCPSWVCPVSVLALRVSQSETGFIPFCAC